MATGQAALKASVVEPSNYESAGDAFTFGRFRLIPSRQLLLRDGVPVQLGSRALEILTVLVRHRGELVSKDALIAEVWPNTFVDESNLKVNVCHLRRSLGDTQKPARYIATVAGRGYRFVAPLQIGVADLADETWAASAPALRGLQPQRDVAGGEQDIADILAALRRSPHVTVYLTPLNWALDDCCLIVRSKTAVRRLATKRKQPCRTEA